MLENIELSIVMSDIKHKGHIEWLDKPVKPRKFRITLNKHYKKKQTLITLAHEVVHLKQYAKGELTDQTTRNNVRWKKREIDEQTIHYFDLPYEVEAYGREWGLYARYMESVFGEEASLKLVLAD
jgi:hypothetical protein